MALKKKEKKSGGSTNWPINCSVIFALLLLLLLVPSFLTQHRFEIWEMGGRLLRLNQSHDQCIFRAWVGSVRREGHQRTQEVFEKELEPPPPFPPPSPSPQPPEERREIIGTRAGQTPIMGRRFTSTSSLPLPPTFVSLWMRLVNGGGGMVGWLAHWRFML